MADASRQKRFPGITTSLIEAGTYFIFIHARETTPLVCRHQPVSLYPLPAQGESTEKKTVFLDRTALPRFCYRLITENAVIPEKERDRAPVLLPTVEHHNHRYTVTLTDPEKMLRRLDLTVEQPNHRLTIPLKGTQGRFRLPPLPAGDTRITDGETVFFEQRLGPPGEGPFCQACGRPFPAVVSFLYRHPRRRTYLPFKEIVDFHGLSASLIGRYIRALPLSPTHKRGYHHLLNMLRTADLDDELEIMQNLYRDDPDFAQQLEGDIFNLDFIPLMWDMDLQRIIADSDNRLLAAVLRQAPPAAKTKLFANMSRRRGQRLRTEIEYPSPAEEDLTSGAADFLRGIRYYFEGKVGRLLTVSADEKRFFRPPTAEDTEKPLQNLDHRLPRYAHGRIAPGEQCLPFVENRRDLDGPLCRTVGISEYTIYLQVTCGLYLLTVYQLDWHRRHEVNDHYGHLPAGTVLTLPRLSTRVTLHLGAITAAEECRESIIRLLIYGGNNPRREDD